MTNKTRLRLLYARKNLLLARDRDNANIVRKINREIRHLEAM